MPLSRSSRSTLIDAPGSGAEGFVIIRRFHPDDVPRLFDAVRESLNVLCTSMTWCRPAYSLENSRAFISKCDPDWERGEQYNLAIVDTRNKTLLGSVGLSQINRTHKFANVGYWVRRNRTGQGIATAATRLMARLAFKELDFNRLELLVARNNLASQRVAEKTGAKIEGILRKRLILAGEPHDALLYSLVADDLVG